MSEERALQHPPQTVVKEIDGSHVVVPPETGGVALDDDLFRLWQSADRRTVAQVSKQMGRTLAETAVFTQTLQRAGLLLPKITLTYPEPPPLPKTPLVSVVVLSKNGRLHLQELLPSIDTQTYPNLEIIVVDDASTDGTGALLAEHFPHVRHIAFKNGPNFAAGNNLGIQHARGELIFLLNNDTRLEPTCIHELVAKYLTDETIGGVAAMMRFYDNPAFINGLGTSIRRFGFGHDLGIGALDVGQFDQFDEVPFLCFGAALIPKAVFEQIGLIFDGYTFYYEDADWSYRARAHGFKLVAAPRAIVYHKFASSTEALPSAFKKRLVVRNRLWFAWKNLPAWQIAPQLSLYFLDDLAHFTSHLVKQEWSVAGAMVQAWGNYYLGLPKMLGARRQTWRGKGRTAVYPHKLAAPFPFPELFARIPRLTTELIDQQYRPFMSTKNLPTSGKNRLLIISPDAVNENMGGVGLRYWELAHQLAKVADVTLAVPQPTMLTSNSVQLAVYTEGNGGTLQPLVQQCDIVLLSGFTLYHHPVLRETAVYKIIDLYDPMVLENLERFANKPAAERDGLHAVGVNSFNDLFTVGDFFICASEKQRDYWLGALTALNRVNPASYSADPSLRRLIDLVPLGLPSEPPVATKPVLKGVRDGIAATDKLIFWGGGLWDWLDPLTVIKAMPQVLEAVPEARLFFLGVRHPNPAVPQSRMAQRAIGLAEEMGLLETAVFYNEWTPYADRANYLCEADVGVSLHGDHIETRFAVRTRLLDYLWARLPMVVGGGDVLGEMVQANGLGMTVEAHNVAQVAAALIKTLQNPVSPAKFDPIIEQLTWEQVAKPLAAYVKQPWRNAGGGGVNTAVSLKPPATKISQLPQKAVQSLREKGASGLWQDVINYLRWIQQH